VPEGRPPDRGQGGPSFRGRAVDSVAAGKGSSRSGTRVPNN